MPAAPPTTPPPKATPPPPRPVGGGAPAATPSRAADDAYAQGYAAAILEREFGVRPGSVTVSGGVATVDLSAVAGVDRDRISTTLGGIRGVRQVVFTRAAPAAALPVPGAARPAQAPPG